jgi:hypothetical protein
MVSFLFLLFLIFYPLKIDYLLNLACGILTSLGPRNVYKDMLNKMVSPIDHVVMNHRNQTRTNGYEVMFATITSTRTTQETTSSS